LCIVYQKICPKEEKVYLAGYSEEDHHRQRENVEARRVVNEALNFVEQDALVYREQKKTWKDTIVEGTQI
jgi:hypothetical protein